jgi:hypothetical protein
VLGLNPEIVALAASDPAVAPRSCEAVWLAPTSPLLVPHKNHACVSDPLGFTVPASIAMVAATPVAGDVAAAGGAAADDAVTTTEFSPVALA